MTAVLLALLLATSPTPTTAGTAGAAAVRALATQPEPAGSASRPGNGGGDEPGPVARDTVAGGTHWRLSTDRGPVHVWRPAGFDFRTAGTLVFVHGFYTDADQSWVQFRLAEQFRRSRRNAQFVVPEAPVGGGERVRWSDLEALLAVLRTGAELSTPPGPVVAMGHSGAFRTLLAWLDSRRLEQIILLDGFYTGAEDFAAWLANPEGERPRHRRMVLVGFETAERSQSFLPGFPEALFREGVPDNPGQFLRRERQARLLYVHSQHDHMGLVTGGRAIPVLLRLSPFRGL